MSKLNKKHKVRYGVHIRVSELKIDPRYQRVQTEARVSSMVKHFDATGFGELQVSCRTDGSYWVIEGGHRAKVAAEINPNVSVPCTVHYGLSLSEEAHLFELFNDTGNVSAIDKYKAGLVSGNPEVCACASILGEFSLVVGSNGGHKVLSCPSALLGIIKRGGSDALRWVLSVATKSWGWKHVVHKQVFLGLDTLNKTYPNGKLDSERLCSVLKSGVEPAALYAKAKSRAMGGEREAPRAFIADTIISLYNKGKSRSGKTRLRHIL